jgi:hypothetical protein
MGSNPWMTHLKAYWAKNKSKGISYRQAMQEAKKTYSKKGASAATKKKKRKSRK